MAKVKRQTPTKKSTNRKSIEQLRLRRLRIRRVLVGILILAGVALISMFLIFGRSERITLPENALGSILTPVQNFVTSVTDGVKGFFTRWRNYDALETDYQALERENTQLKLELDSAEESIRENERLKTLLDAADTYSALDPVYAKVIARDAGPWFETFSINKGSGSGITNGMAVVNGNGLIGRVYAVGMNYAKVISIIDSRSAVACLVQRTRDNGIMRGQISASDSIAECFVYYLPNINSITPGDTVVTSGTDSLYPKGLKIGTVTALSLNSGSDGTYAIVSPSVDFQRIEEVLVLRTVIETDTDRDSENLPSTVFETLAPTPSATIVPGPAATPTPTADPSIEEHWSRPTQQPADGSDTSKFYISDLIEDTWAAS